MNHKDLIMEGRDALLYHGYRDIRHACSALATGKMAATSTQRFWGDGRRRKDNEPDYEDSYWMKGISFTRDLKFAMGWGRLVIAVDQAKLAHNTKIIPFNWGYSIPNNNNNHKREREEYAVIKSTPDKYERSEEDGGGTDMNRFLSKNGIEGWLSLTPILAGLWLEADIASLFEPGPSRYDIDLGKHVREGIVKKESNDVKTMAEAGYPLEKIINNPLFKGYYQSPSHFMGNRNWKFWPPNTPREDLPPREI